MSLWEDVKNNLVELYTTTSEKTTEIARVTTRKYDKFGISRDIERQFSELGNLVYTGLKEGREDILGDPALETLMTRIEGLEAELAQKDQEIDDIKQEYAERKTQAKAAAAAGGTTEDATAEAVATEPIPDQGPEVDALRVETDPTPVTDTEMSEPEAAPAPEPAVTQEAEAMETTGADVSSETESEPEAESDEEREKPENAG